MSWAGFDPLKVNKSVFYVHTHSGEYVYEIVVSIPGNRIISVAAHRNNTVNHDPADRMATALEFYREGLKTRLAINEQVAVTDISGIFHGADNTLHLFVDGKTVSIDGIFQQFKGYHCYRSLGAYSREIAYESYAKFVAFLVNVKG